MALYNIYLQNLQYYNFFKRMSLVKKKNGSSRSMKSFDRCKINKDFLNIEPSNQENKENYQIKNIPVINDISERGVMLIEEYNEKITKDESQKKYLMQVVYYYHKKYLDSEKGTLMRDY